MISRTALTLVLLIGALWTSPTLNAQTADEVKALNSKWDSFERKLRDYERSLQATQSRYNGAEVEKRDIISRQYKAIKARAVKQAKELVAEIDGFITKYPKNKEIRVRRLDDTVFTGLNPTIKAKDAEVLAEITSDGAFIHKAAKFYENAYQYADAVRMWEKGLERAVSYANMKSLGDAYMHNEQFTKARDIYQRSQAKASDKDKRRESQTMTLIAGEYVAKWAAEQKFRENSDTNPIAEIVTDRGTMKVELFEDQAPNSVANFIELANKKFYDGLMFHRCTAYFMIQGGDPEGTGIGGPGYKVKDEFARPDARFHYPGTLSMANTGRPDTNGSQFFVTSTTTHWLNKKHTVFGRIIEPEGLKVPRVKPIDPTNKAKPFRIKTIRILKKRDHVYEAQKIR
ncbi:MAG: peptidylprolyl isomerase [Planctomycetota bacterium]